MSNFKEINMEELENRLYAPVEKVALEDKFPDISRFPTASSHAIVDENGGILSFCGKGYGLVKNADIFKPLEKAVRESGIPFDKKITIVDDTKFYVEYTIKNSIKAQMKVDDVFPVINISNSYDGTLKRKADVGCKRLVCGNGLTVAVGKSYSDSRKHSKHISTEEFVVETVKVLKQYVEEFGEQIIKFEEMDKKSASKKTISSLGKKMKLPKKVIDIAKERYDFEVKGGFKYVNGAGELVTHEGSPTSLFTAYNALNFAIYNTNEKELPEKKLEKDEKLMAHAVKMI